jgi:hypothetical protein
MLLIVRFNVHEHLEVEMETGTDVTGSDVSRPRTELRKAFFRELNDPQIVVAVICRRL